MPENTNEDASSDGPRDSVSFDLVETCEATVPTVETSTREYSVGTRVRRWLERHLPFMAAPSEELLVHVSQSVESHTVHTRMGYPLGEHKHDTLAIPVTGARIPRADTPVDALAVEAHPQDGVVRAFYPLPDQYQIAQLFWAPLASILSLDYYTPPAGTTPTEAIHDQLTGDILYTATPSQTT